MCNSVFPSRKGLLTRSDIATEVIFVVPFEWAAIRRPLEECAFACLSRPHSDHEVGLVYLLLFDALLLAKVFAKRDFACGYTCAE